MPKGQDAPYKPKERCSRDLHVPVTHATTPASTWITTAECERLPSLPLGSQEAGTMDLTPLHHCGLFFFLLFKKLS